MADESTPSWIAKAQWRRLETIRARVAARAVAVAAAAGFENLPLDTIAQMVLAGQRATVVATDAGLSFAAGVATATDVTPVGLDTERLIGRRVRRGQLLEEVYARVGKVAREDGPERAQQYLETLIRNDMQLAQREAAYAHSQADRRVVGWRRQVNPAGETCGLCVVASTRVYGKINKLQIHANCNCSVHEVYTTDLSESQWDTMDENREAVSMGVHRSAGTTPGAVFDQERLDAAYEQAGSWDKKSLSRIKFEPDQLPPGQFDEKAVESLRTLNVEVVDHPELGAMLTGHRHDLEFVTN